MDDKIDFSVIRQARLTQTEFGDLCKVSRVTVNLWVKGKMQPHRYNRELVAQYAETVAHALKSKKLPLAHGLKGKARALALRTALALPEKTH